MKLRRIAELFWLLLQLGVNSGQWDTDIGWCQYKIFTNPKTWQEAREICKQFSMRLLHISDVEQHNYLTSMFQTSMLQVEPYNPSFSFWLGLHKPQNGTPRWQDDCGSIDAYYNPLRKLVLTPQENCFMFNQHDQYYTPGLCDDGVNPYICESTSYDLDSCYSTTDRVADGELYSDEIVQAPTDCISYCYDPACIGFRWNLLQDNGRCYLLSHAIGKTYMKGMESEKFVKAIFNTETILLSSTLYPDVCQQQPTIATTSFTDPSPLSLGVPVITSSSAEQPLSSSTVYEESSIFLLQLVSSSTATVFEESSISPQQLVSSSTVLTTYSRGNEWNEEPLQITKALNSETEPKLTNLDARIVMATVYNNDDLTQFAAELMELVALYPQDVCQHLETVIGIEKNITEKARMLGPYDMCMIIDDFIQVLSIMNGYALDNTGCTQFMSKADIIAFEDILVLLSKLTFTWTNSEHTEKTNCSFEHEGISMKIFFEDGGKLQRDYKTTHGGIAFQHPHTLQGLLDKQRLLVSVLSYKEDRIRNSIGQDNITTSVVKMGVYHSDGRAVTEIMDSLIVEVQDAPLPENTNDLKKPMLPLGSEYLVALPAGLSQNGAVIIFLDISFTESCQIHGKYGTDLPTEYNYDVLVLTRQDSEVTKYRPYDLSFLYSNGILQMSMISTPVIITTKCQEITQRFRRSLPSGSSNSSHQIVPTITTRIVDPKVWNSPTGKWTSAAGLTKVTGNPSQITFETFFFGAFSASVQWIPPDTIDFQTVFLNFSEKLNNTPYVLATIVSVIIILVVLSPFLRSLDQKDSALWAYQHLKDNKRNSPFKYYLLLSTGLRSARAFTSSVYIDIIGSRATTGTRLLCDGSKQNFERGTSCHFCLTTEQDLGHVETIQIWHDGSGSSPSWFLSKIVVVEGKAKNTTVLCCNKWLSIEKEQGQIWQALDVYKECNRTTSFADVSCRRLFDDDLWFSLLFRPHYSRFTRVQRLWCVVSLLLLSMVASAMFYDTPDVRVPLISLSGFDIAYKDLYVGLMSSVITVIPGIIMIYIFNNRKLRGEKRMDIVHEGQSVRSTGYLPWWFIFVAYGILLSGIAACSFFTFLYSLEWGSALTIKWMSSFFLGTAEGVVFVEPAKAFILAMVFISCFSAKLDKKQFNLPTFPSYFIKEADPTPVVDNPCNKAMTKDQLRRRRLLQLERKTYAVLKEWIILVLYLCVVLLIGSHQRINDGYRQNTHISNIAKPSQEITSFEDMWFYLEHTLLQRLSPITFYNGDAIPHASLRFVGTNYKLGPIRLRQVRSTGASCRSSRNGILLSNCNPDAKYTEDTENYLEGWVPINASMTTREHDPFRYRTHAFAKSVPYLGTFDTYGGGGYLLDLSMEHSVAVPSVLELKQHDWLDTKTRVLFVEVLVMNTNTMLFSQLQVIFEIPRLGGVFTNIEVVTSNLYPYKDTLDYAVLLLQVLFVIITLIRLILLIVTGVRSRFRCFLNRKHVLQIITIAVSFAAIGCLIMRTVTTINGLNRLHVDDGFLTSFGEVFLWDQYYSVCVGLITFIAILDLLKALTFNYQLYLMYHTMSSFLWEMCHFTITLAILIFGFGSFTYLLYGALDAEFKSIPDSCMSMLRMTVALVKMRHFSEQMKDEGVLIMFGLGGVVLTITFINLFVSALNHGLNETKTLIDKGRTDFDSQLNRYIWQRIINVCMCSSRTEILVTDDFGEDYKTSRCRRRVLDLTQGEKTFAMLCSTLTKYYENDSTLERNIFLTLLAKLSTKGPNCLWRKITTVNQQILYTFSKDELGKDTILTMKLHPKQPNKRVDVECMSINEATQMGLIPYGANTKPLSQFCIIHRKDDAGSECTVTLKLETPSQSAFVIVKPSFGTDWEQHSASMIENIPNEPGHATAVIAGCPCYILAVSCTSWPQIAPDVLRDRKETFVLTQRTLSITPSSSYKLSLTFSEDVLEQEPPIIEIVMETVGQLPTFHLVASKDINRPLKVNCEDKRNRDELSIENFMELQILTKDGDLEWKLEHTTLRVNRGSVTFYVDNIRKGVKKAVAVMRSNYRISFSESDNRHLEREKAILLGIYRDRIYTKHWRHIGMALGMTPRELNNLETKKPRSLQEKACMVLGMWLKGNPSRSLREIHGVWN